MERAGHDADFLDWWMKLNAGFAESRSAEARLTLMDGEIRALGFDCFAYGCRRPVPFNQKQAFITGSYPPQWLERYNQKAYGTCDPSIAKALGAGLVIWAEHDDLLSSPLFQEAREWHLNVGATFIMRGRHQCVHMLGVARRSEAISPCEALMLKLKLRCIVDLVDEHWTDQGAAELDIALTERETEILRWIADGKCSRSVSEILGLSEHTVNFHVKSIQRKFGSSNRILAAAYAVAMGVL